MGYVDESNVTMKNLKLTLSASATLLVCFCSAQLTPIGANLHIGNGIGKHALTSHDWFNLRASSDSMYFDDPMGRNTFTRRLSTSVKGGSFIFALGDSSERRTERELRVNFEYVHQHGMTATDNHVYELEPGVYHHDLNTYYYRRKQLQIGAELRETFTLRKLRLTAGGGLAAAQAFDDNFEHYRIEFVSDVMEPTYIGYSPKCSANDVISAINTTTVTGYIPVSIGLVCFNHFEVALEGRFAAAYDVSRDAISPTFYLSQQSMLSLTYFLKPPNS